MFSIFLVIFSLTFLVPNSHAAGEIRRKFRPQTTGHIVDPKARIFGGDVAQKGQFPYMVLVLYNRAGSFERCSASLVSEEVVLLAAHCLGDNPDPSKLMAVGGQADMTEYMKIRHKLPWSDNVSEKALGVQERRAVYAKRHENYNSITKAYDIALFRVAKPFILSSSVGIIQISTDKLKSRTPCTIHGWGLQEGNMVSYKLAYAEGIYARPTEEGCRDTSVTGPFICLEQSNSGICQGDSGSPLVCDDKVWGVASYLSSYVADPDCSDDFEEYFADIYPGLSLVDEFLKVSADEDTSLKVQENGNGGGGIVALDILSVFACIVMVLARKAAV